MAAKSAAFRSKTLHFFLPKTIPQQALLCVRDSSGNFFAPKGKKIAANSPTRRETPKNSALNLILF
jgi:hypothetical protein